MNFSEKIMRIFLIFAWFLGFCMNPLFSAIEDQNSIQKIDKRKDCMNYSVQEKETIKIIGISIRTTNKEGQSVKDISAFWQKFFQENIVSKIPNKKGTDIFCLYTNYEGDFMAPYTVIIGCEVETFDQIPEGMISKIIPKAQYAVFTTDSTQQVSSKWNQIWQTKLDRTYLTDFEVYKNALSITNPVVDICVGIR
jgi:predicted transcriptional regulator YdeE